MTHRGPFQPLLFCDSVILRGEIPYSFMSEMLCFAPTVFLCLRAGKHLLEEECGEARLVSKFISKLLCSKRYHILFLVSLV